MSAERDSDHRHQMTDRERFQEANTRDEWGDLDAWTHTNGRRNLIALGADEEEPRERAFLPSSDEVPERIAPSQDALAQTPAASRGHSTTLDVEESASSTGSRRRERRESRSAAAIRPASGAPSAMALAVAKGE